jgi:hypothetical protein
LRPGVYVRVESRHQVGCRTLESEGAAGALILGAELQTFYRAVAQQEIPGKPISRFRPLRSIKSCMVRESTLVRPPSRQNRYTTRSLRVRDCPTISCRILGHDPTEHPRLRCPLRAPRRLCSVLFLRSYRNARHWRAFNDCGMNGKTAQFALHCANRLFSATCR